MKDRALASVACGLIVLGLGGLLPRAGAANFSGEPRAHKASLTNTNPLPESSQCLVRRQPEMNEARLAARTAQNMIEANGVAAAETSQWRNLAAASALLWTIVGLASLMLLATLLFFKLQQRLKVRLLAEGAKMVEGRTGVFDHDRGAKQSYRALWFQLIIAASVIALALTISGFFTKQGEAVSQFKQEVQSSELLEMGAPAGSPIVESEGRRSLLQAKIHLVKRLRLIRIAMLKAEEMLRNIVPGGLFGWDQVTGIDIQLASIEQQQQSYHHYRDQALGRIGQVKRACGD